jgi:hypothetical protein
MTESLTGMIESICPNSRKLMTLIFLGVVNWPRDLTSAVMGLAVCTLFLPLFF